jgi:PIN domain nuclease of toxin-antitoxin system
MELLLDTHALIWFINGDDSLPDKVKDEIKDVRNKCFLSTGSLWEIAIKTSLGKLELKSDFNKVFPTSYPPTKLIFYRLLSSTYRSC